MAADNNQTSSPTNPIGTASDTSQQSWLELDQQGLGGETLKAKQWTTKRRVVDSSQHVGNIHTGTEKAVELDKSDALTEEALQNQGTQEGNTSTEIKSSDPNFQTSANARPSAETFTQDPGQDASQTTETTRQNVEQQSVVQGGGDDSLVFDEHFETDSDDRSSQRDQSKSSAPQQTTLTQATTEIVDESSPDPASTTAATPPPAPSAAVISTTPQPLPEEETEEEIEIIPVDSSASAPTLNAEDSHGIEDTAIALELSSSLTDTDGSESLTITIEGVPIGATLSAGQNLGNGAWQLTREELTDLTLSPPTNSDEDFSLTITATSTESHGGATSSLSEVIDVFMEAVADTPILTAEAATGNEDTAINLNIDAALTDIDGSETLSAITITDVPDDAQLSAGSKNNDGSWSLSQDELEGLQITPGQDSNDDFQLSLSVTATDSNGSTVSSNTVLPVTVIDVADAAIITGEGGSVTEDGGLRTDSPLILNDGDTRGEVLVALVADNGGELLGGQSAISFSMDINIADTPGNEDIPLLSYATDRRHNNEFRVLLKPEDDGNSMTLEVKFGGDGSRNKSYSEKINSADIFDGDFHNISVSIDEEGNVQFSFDEANVGDGAVRPHTLRSGGVLVFGQEQDDVGSRFDIHDEFISGQIGEISISSGGENLAQWDMGTITQDGTIADQSGNGHGLSKTTITSNRDNVLELANDQIDGQGGTNNAGHLTTSGQLLIVDPDAGENHFNTETIEGTYGSLELAENGSWTYTLNNNADNVQRLDLDDTVTDSITIHSVDGSSHDLVMTVNGTNDLPSIATITQKTVTEDGVGVTGTVTATDVDADDTLTFTAQNADGLSFNADGSYSFDPSHDSYQSMAEGETRTISVPVTVVDSNGATDSQNLIFTLKGSNDIPTVSGAVALPGGTEDTSQSFTTEQLLANSDDIDTSDILTVENLSVDASQGTLTNNNDGTYTFTPKSDYNGSVALNYDVTDGRTSVPVTAGINLEAVNDAPVITDAKALDLSEESMEGFSGYGETWEGDVYSVVTQAEMLEHLGITDVDSDTFTVSLADAGVAWHDGIQANDSVFTSDTLNSGSARGDESVVQVTQDFLDNYPNVDAQVGDFYFDHVDFDSLSEGEIANINFSVQVSDGETTSEPSNFEIVVTGSNDAPVVSGAVILPEGQEDNVQSFTVSDLLANSSDQDTNDTLSVSNVTVDPEQGVLTSSPDGTFTFTPKADYNGTVNINYDVTDGKTTVATTAEINLEAVNDNPIAAADTYQNTELLNSENPGNQTDGAPSGTRVIGIYAQGSDANLLDGKNELLTLNDHNYFEHNSLGHTGYNYMGGNNWFADNDINLSGLRGGIIAFEDGTQGIIDTSSNGVTRDRDGDGTIDYEENAYIYYNAYEPLGDLETLEDRSLTILPDTLLINDSDADSSSLSITDVANATNGTVALNEDGTITFEPDSNFSGEATFTYTVDDGQGGNSSTTVTLNIQPAVDKPEISFTTASGDEDSSIAINIDVALSDTDGSETLGQILVQGVPDDATLSAGQQNNDGSWTLTQNELEGLTVTPGTNNNQDFTLQISTTATESNGDVATTTIELPVTVNAVNDAPDAVNDRDNGILDSENPGSQTDGAVRGTRVTGLYANGSDENLLDGKSELTTLSDHSYFDHGSLGHTGYNYMGGHDWFADNDISLSELRGGIITFEDGTQGIIDTSSNGVTRDRDGDGTTDYEENAYIYYNAYEVVGELDTQEDTPLTIAQDTLLANDTDVDGDTLSITAVSSEVVDSDGNIVGTAEQDSAGNIVFTPGNAMNSLAEGESKDVNFTYTVSDGQGGTDTATASITVQGTDNDLTYVSETAGYKNVVGIYEIDEDGNPVSGTVVIDDQNGMAGGTHLADLEPGNHEFFIIANGANEINDDSTISFDTSGEKPVLLIDGEPASHPVYYTEPTFNPDDKDHFQFESDGEGGTFVNIEDLPDLGDADFGDVVLHTNFEMEDRIVDETPPDAPTIDLATSSDTGDSNADDITADHNPLLTGTAEAGSTVTLYADGEEVGTTTADENGDWSYNYEDQGRSLLDRPITTKSEADVRPDDSSTNETNNSIDNAVSFEREDFGAFKHNFGTDDNDADQDGHEIVENVKNPNSLSARFVGEINNTQDDGSTNTSVDADWVKVTLNAGEKLVLDVDYGADGNIWSTEGSVDTELRVFNSDSELVDDVESHTYHYASNTTEAKQDDDLSPTDGGEGSVLYDTTGADARSLDPYYEFTAPADGDYYVQVTAYNNGSKSDSGSYELWMSIENPQVSFTATATDSSGNVSDSTDSLTVTIDTEAILEADNATQTAQLIDGAVEGIEFTTSSGLHGYTEADGSFSFRDGDDITFNVGGVTLGTATAEDVASGQTFLQDIADVDRTDLNDEYLENMATFLQSIDENSDAYDGIVVTEEIREALADADIDLRTASEEEVEQLVEQIGLTYVEEDAAMDHVQDMLVEHTDLTHEEFDEHVDDELSESNNSVSAAAAVTAEATDSAVQDFNETISSDLSLNVPSLTLPGEAEESSREESDTVLADKQETAVQDQSDAPGVTNVDGQMQTDILTDGDLSHSLPSASLSNLFDDAETVASEVNDQETTGDDSAKQDENPKEQVTAQPVEAATTDSSATVDTTDQQQETAASPEGVTETGVPETQETDELVDDEADLSTDALSIALDTESENETPQANQQEDSSLDRFTANGSEEQKEGNDLNQFSANDDSTGTEEMASVDKIDNAEAESADQIEDAGLSADDGIQEELPQESEQVDNNIG